MVPSQWTQEAQEAAIRARISAEPHLEDEMRDGQSPPGSPEPEPETQPTLLEDSKAQGPLSVAGYLYIYIYIGGPSSVGPAPCKWDPHGSHSLQVGPDPHMGYPMGYPPHGYPHMGTP